MDHLSLQKYSFYSRMKASCGNVAEESCVEWYLFVGLWLLGILYQGADMRIHAVDLCKTTKGKHDSMSVPFQGH